MLRDFSVVLLLSSINFKIKFRYSSQGWYGLGSEGKGEGAVRGPISRQGRGGTYVLCRSNNRQFKKLIIQEFPSSHFPSGESKYQNWYQGKTIFN